MKNCIIGSLFAASLLASGVYAKDSTWMLGDDKIVALNLLEHRVGAGDRATEIALIEGAWILTGQLKEGANGYPHPAKITLKATNASFTGTIDLDYGSSKSSRKGSVRAPNEGTVKLKGKLELQGTTIDLNQTIPYHILDGV